MVDLLPQELEAILTSVIKLVESVPTILTNITSGENPVDVIQTLLETLEQNPINELLKGLPIIGNVVTTLENILTVISFYDYNSSVKKSRLRLE